MPQSPDTLKALSDLRQILPRAAQELDLDFGEPFVHWAQTLDCKLLPRLRRDFPLVAAICGGGSTGKSTLFNSIAGEPVSPTGGRAGLNRRVLVAIGKEQKRKQELLDYLGHAFELIPQRIENQSQLLSPGPPLFCESEAIPEGVVLLDTPDIDTGAGGRYANRDLARQSLEVADLFLYIFTNATYNNLDNTDFIARMLTGMGTRPSFLIYRVYPSFADEEVRDHARTVTRNIYGADGDQHVLGLFRADEDNEVAAGQIPLAVKSMSDTQQTLATVLGTLDPAPMRARMLATMSEDAMHQAKEMAERVRSVKEHLDAYARAYTAAQNECIQKALSHFPTDRVLRRFAQIWLEGDPAHIKLMRGTGKVLEWPMKTVLKTVRRLKSPGQIRKPPTSEEKLTRQVNIDLLTAANQLYKISVDAKIPDQGRSIAVPAVVRPAQMRLENRPWKMTLETITDRQDTLLAWSTQLDTELKTLADRLRERMGILDQVRQTFAAMLNVIPATAAITYILHTGDPMGAAGIKVKLTGLFGLQDLYALIAIPATAGMSKADRAQLEQMLGPLARTWLEHKLTAVQELFETHISGELLADLTASRNSAEARVREIDQALAAANMSVVPRETF